MKRRMTLIALMLSVVLVTVITSASVANAQQGGRRSVADTGMLTLGPNEVIRLSVVPKDVASGPIVVRFRRIEYGPASCGGGACKHLTASQITSEPITLNRGEAASFEMQNSAFGLRGMVLSSSPNVEVRGIVFDTATQRIVAICTFIPD